MRKLFVAFVIALCSCKPAQVVPPIPQEHRAVDQSRLVIVAESEDGCQNYRIIRDVNTDREYLVVCTCDLRGGCAVTAMGAKP